MKINFGCGFNKMPGYLNVDKFSACNPDQVLDTEVFPWPLESDSVDESIFKHSLEHMGASSDCFIKIMQELYRVSKNDALVIIHAPHPRHDTFLGDPTHVRVITPTVMDLFNKKLNLHWQATGVANSQLALYTHVDFEVQNVTHILENKYLQLLQNGSITDEELRNIANELNNVVVEYHMVLKVIKPFS